MKPGDTVIYTASPLLYGEMEVGEVLKDGYLRCIVDPDGLHPSFEVFDVQELEISGVRA